jgi:hypothetical protein
MAEQANEGLPIPGSWVPLASLIGAPMLGMRWRRQG